MLKRPFIISSIVFILLLGLTQFFVYQQIKLSRERAKEELIRESGIVRDRFRSILYSDITAANAMAIIYKQNGLNNFDSAANDIIKNNPYAEALQLTEDGIIKKVYPLAGYESTIGINTQTDPMRKSESDKAIGRNNIYFAGPRKLREGGVGILGKVPVIIDGKAKGLCVVLTRLPTIIRLLRSDDSVDNRFAYALRKNNSSDTTVYILSSEKLGSKSDIVRMNIPEGDWQLCVGYNELFSNENYPYSLSIIGFLCSLIAALFVYRIAAEPYRLERVIRKKTKELSLSEERFRRTFEYAAIGKAVVDLNGNITQVNKSLCDMIGYSAEELQKMTIRQITHPDDIERDEKFIQRSQQENINVYHTEKRYVHKNGSAIWINLNVVLVRDESKQPLFFVSQIENITEKKETEQKFQGLVERSLVGVYILQDGRFVYVNPRMSEESGYTEEELTSMPIDHFVHPDDIALVRGNILRRMSGEVSEVRYTTRALCKNGSIIWLDMFGTVMEFRGKPAIIGTMVNITRQMEDQEIIKKREAELSALFDNVDGSASLLDDHKRYLIYNRSFVKDHLLLTGHEPSPGQEVYDGFPDDIRAERLAMLDEVLKGSKKILEVNYFRNGKRVYYKTTFNPVIAEGKVIGISTYSIDLSEIRNAEQEILRLNRIYQFISQINEEMLRLTNRQEIFAQACRIAVDVGKFHMAWVNEYNRKDGTFDPVASAGHEDGFFQAIDVKGMDLATSAIPSARAIRTNRYFYYNDIANDPDIPTSLKEEMLKRNYRSALSFPIKVNSDVVAAFVLLMSEPFFFNEDEIALLKEVTDNIEYALDKIWIRTLREKTEANLRSVFDTTTVSYLMLDSDLNIVSANQRMKDIYIDLAGIKIREGANMIDLLIPEKRENARNIYKKVLETGIPVEYESNYETGGFRRCFYVTVVPVKEQDKVAGLCISSVEITQVKALETERERIINDLLQRNRDLEQFAHIVSHNIRGPLATILGLYQLLLDEKHDESLDYIIQGIGGSATRLDQVIIDLNEILNIRNDNSEIKHYIDLGLVLDQVKTNIAQQIAKSDAVIEQDLVQAPGVEAINSYIHSIFYNLITNAIKYTKEGVAPLIRIRTEKHDGHIQIIVSDNGRGIDTARYADRLFGLYQKFHLNVEGKGLGLFMTKTQVEAMNGRIEVQSTPGEGTTFTIILPA
jgi:PAS domain S-box-containing protein